MKIEQLLTHKDLIIRTLAKKAIENHSLESTIKIGLNLEYHLDIKEPVMAFLQFKKQPFPNYFSIRIVRWKLKEHTIQLRNSVPCEKANYLIIQILNNGFHEVYSSINNSLVWGSTRGAKAGRHLDQILKNWIGGMEKENA